MDRIPELTPKLAMGCILFTGLTQSALTPVLTDFNPGTGQTECNDMSPGTVDSGYVQ